MQEVSKNNIFNLCWSIFNPLDINKSVKCLDCYGVIDAPPRLSMNVLRPHGMNVLLEMSQKIYKKRTTYTVFKTSQNET